MCRLFILQTIFSLELYSMVCKGILMIMIVIQSSSNFVIFQMIQHKPIFAIFFLSHETVTEKVQIWIVNKHRSLQILRDIKITRDALWLSKKECTPIIVPKTMTSTVTYTCDAVFKQSKWHFNEIAHPSSMRSVSSEMNTVKQKQNINKWTMLF